jgi:NAD(P)-dependent dehydrogenase (short-subunit alcohol dehydrogenase family)
MFAEKLRIDGARALVVGAGGGRMGTHSAIALAEAGATVVGVDVSDDALQVARNGVAEAGGKFVGLVADVTSESEVRDCVDRAWTDVGPITHLVNVVGGSRPDEWYTVDAYPTGMLDRILALNLASTFYMAHEVTARMVAEQVRGVVVNFGSVSAAHGAPLHGPYAAAKAAVLSLTKTMACELGPYGIRVNAVSPGATEEARGTYTSVRRLRDPSWNPLQRGPHVAEIAGAVLFLASDLSGGMTGQTLVVDAGATARSPLGGLDWWLQWSSAHDKAGVK